MILNEKPIHVAQNQNVDHVVALEENVRVTKGIRGPLQTMTF